MSQEILEDIEAVRPWNGRQRPGSTQYTPPRPPTTGSAFVTQDAFNAALNQVKTDVKTLAAAHDGLKARVIAQHKELKKEISGLKSQSQLSAILPLLMTPPPPQPTYKTLGAATPLQDNTGTAIPSIVTKIDVAPQSQSMMLPLVLMLGMGGGQGTDSSSSGGEGMGMMTVVVLMMAMQAQAAAAAAAAAAAKP